MVNIVDALIFSGTTPGCLQYAYDKQKLTWGPEEPLTNRSVLGSAIPEGMSENGGGLWGGVLEVGTGEGKGGRTRAGGERHPQLFGND